MTNLIPKDKEELIKAAIIDMTAKVNNLKIDSKESMQFASNVLGEVKVRINRLDELKKELTKPFADAVRGANNWFKSQQEPFKTMEMKIKTEMTVYVEAEERKAAKMWAEAEEERKRLEVEREKKVKEAEKAGEPEPEPLPEVIPEEVKKISVQTVHGKVITKKIWTYDVVDIEKVPREFLTFDRAKITNAVRSGEREIPGVKIYQKTSISA